MSYYLYDAKGYIADLSTTSGLVDMTRWVNKQNGLTHLKGFLHKGAAFVTDKLLDDLDNITTKGPKSVIDTIKNLRENIQYCDTVAIISDGANNEVW